MPLKLPAPDLGTDAQPEPKFMAVVEAEPDGMAEAMDDDEAEAEGDDEADEAEVPELPELQAARPRVRPAADTPTARKRRFTISPMVRSLRGFSRFFRPELCSCRAGCHARGLSRPWLGRAPVALAAVR
jgi:hypothetical protein